MRKRGKELLDGRLGFGLREALLLTAVGVAIAVAAALTQI